MRVLAPAAGAAQAPAVSRRSRVISLRMAGLVGGPLLFLMLLLLPAPPHLAPGGWHVAALLAWMVAWWCSDAVPAPVTALLPFPVLTILGVASPEQAARSHASPILLFLLGGAVIAIAAAKTGLHLRIARMAVRFGGGGPRRLVLAVMAATAFTGMWVSTTITTLFMVEIGIALAAAVAAANPADEAQLRRFSCAMVIGIAYAALFGGFSTLTGNLFNAMAAGLISRQTGQAIGFLDWLGYGLPIAMLGVPLAWMLIVAIGFPFKVRLPDQADLIAALEAPKGWSSAQIAVASIMAMVAAAWLAMDLIRAVLPGLSDPAVALIGAVLMFLVPSSGGGRLLTWEDARKLPWGVLVIAGGALALGAAITDTGLDAWLARPLEHVAGMPPWIALLALVAGAVLLTELVNNVAMVTITIPVSIALASAVGADPIPFAIAGAIGGLGGFVLPGAPYLAVAAGTPPVRIADLARAGVWLMLLTPFLITSVALLRLAAD